ncbi:MAG: LysM peptidoglycan-binding domain-containing protein [Marinoscillum sp.]
MQLKYKLTGIIIAFFCVLEVQAFGFDSLRTEEKEGTYYVIHQVEKGETLYSLTRRYGSNLLEVKEANGMEDNNLDLGQELRIPITYNPPKVSSKPSPETSESNHLVKTGETLFSISRKYGVEVNDLKEWNQLATNEISIGQLLKVRDAHAPFKSDSSIDLVKEDKKKKKKEDDKAPAKPAIRAGFTEYYVQSGDMIESIAAKFKVRPDSIVIWNKLPNTYLSIGQKLLIKGKPDPEELKKKPNIDKLPYGTRKRYTDQSGFVKIIEEGTARKIEDVVETEKYLALHRTLKIGTMIEIRNLMNNQKIFARVVGRLPETGLNENVLVRLTPICFERLGVIDPLTRVEVTYYED